MAARLFNLMLCALLLGLSGPAAKAITHSENRVGGSPVFSSDFASQESAKPIAASEENAVCGYDFTSGVHKYLYAQANPVNRIDPSGHDAGDTISTLVAVGIAFNLASATYDAVSAARANAVGDYRGAAQHEAWFTVDVLLLAIPYSGMGGTISRGGSLAIEAYVQASTGVAAKLGGANAAAHIIYMFAQARRNGGSDSGDTPKSNSSTGRQDTTHSGTGAYDSARVC